MFDIHSHVLPTVDDGSPSVETSLQMLKVCVEQGITDVYLTPHYRGRCKLPKQKVIERFEQFQNAVKERGIPVNLYLSEEVYYDDSIFDNVSNAEFLTFGDTKYLLLELGLYEDEDVEPYDAVYEAVSCGYKPIIAHIERHNDVSVAYAQELKSIGALIQVNADSIADKSKKCFTKIVFKLIKAGLVDFVASDYHYVRINYMAEAYKIVKKKFGQKVADSLFNDNAKKIFKGAD